MNSSRTRLARISHQKESYARQKALNPVILSPRRLRAKDLNYNTLCRVESVEAGLNIYG